MLTSTDHGGGSRMDIDYGRYYRRYHDDSDRHFGEALGCAAAKLAPLLPTDRKARILEIGCGMGFALGALQQLGYADIEGIDADGGQIAAARRRHLPALHVPVEASADFLSARTETCDTVICIDVLEHVPVADQLGFLRGILAALKPGGSTDLPGTERQRRYRQPLPLPRLDASLQLHRGKPRFRPAQCGDSPISTLPRPSRRGARAFPSYPAARWRGGCCARASGRCGVWNTALSLAPPRRPRSR